MPITEEELARSQFADTGTSAEGLIALYQRCVHLGCRFPGASRRRASSALPRVEVRLGRGVLRRSGTTQPRPLWGRGDRRQPGDQDRHHRGDRSGHRSGGRVPPGSVVHRHRRRGSPAEGSGRHPGWRSVDRHRRHRGGGRARRGLARLPRRFEHPEPGPRGGAQRGPRKDRRRTGEPASGEGPGGCRGAHRFLAFYLPIYYLGEQDRQAGFVEQFDEESLERGAEVVASVGCTDCHGSDWSGGGASYVEKRSGINVNWAAPALNDVFYRYDAEEVRYWIVYGRANTPMPAWGTEGGGPLDEQQVSDVINYLATQQIDQQAALAKIDPSVDLQLQRSTRPMPASPRPSPTRSSCSPTSRLRPIRRRWYSKPPPELPSWWRAEARASMPMATVSPIPPRPNWSRSWRTPRAALIPDGLVVETLDESPSRSRERPTRDRRGDGGFARATGGERSGAAAAGRGRRYRPRRAGRRRRSRRRRALRRVGTDLLAALPSSTTARADRASRHPARSAEPADRRLAAGHRGRPPSGQRPPVAGHLPRCVRLQPGKARRAGAAGPGLPVERR